MFVLFDYRIIFEHIEPTYLQYIIINRYYHFIKIVTQGNN